MLHENIYLNAASLQVGVKARHVSNVKNILEGPRYGYDSRGITTAMKKGETYV